MCVSVERQRIKGVEKVKKKGVEKVKEKEGRVNICIIVLLCGTGIKRKK